ncbi:CHD5 domain protein [Ceratobasidium sp. AG-Ba]|nr:CHD5 domain protein [Ceratobasidium sp. AG-Ba]QRW02566.1 CHD5 domain protein [Ceratobasidium sp. AG-Ba]
MDEREYDYIPETEDQFGKEVALFSEIASINTQINCEYDCIDWTYAIDFDYRAFSVNGKINFNLDNMPPRNPGIAAYFREEALAAPPEYLTTVSYWPNPGHDVDLVPKEYGECGATITTVDSWNAPSWGFLSTSQHLSADLVKGIVSDYQKILSIPDSFVNYNRIIMICWQIVCAAAPSHVICSDWITPAAEGLLYSKMAIKGFDSDGRLIPWRVVKGIKNFTRPSPRFRGRLIKFFYRLDDETYLKREVTKIATKTKTKGSADGNIGIIMSSW